MDLGQYDAIRDTRLQAIEARNEALKESEGVLREIRLLRREIASNLSIEDISQPINKELHIELTEKLESLLKIFE